MAIKSPITSSERVTLEQEIPSAFLIEQYKKELDIDVSRFFVSIPTVGIYRCNDTGYRFYYPDTTAGDGPFYQELEKYPWYYMSWKWEHEIAKNLVKPGDNVLEIGCAHGTFLKRLKEMGARAEGLEMNAGALDDCRKNGLTVSPDSIEEFSKKRPHAYDMVCSFQVVEHVADIKGFIEASLAVLKPGGRMVVAVPNNENFKLKSATVLLDMPPHHMGQWTINSLIKLQNHFDMRIESIHQEPLQQYHTTDAIRLAHEKLYAKLKAKLGPLAHVVFPFAKPFARAGVNAVREAIIGHTIVAVYRKNP